MSRLTKHSEGKESKFSVRTTPRREPEAEFPFPTTPGASQLTGTRALMLAVLEDGIRSFLGSSRVLAHDAEQWILSRRRQSPFSFIVVCEVLGFAPEAVRERLLAMKSSETPTRRTLPRARRNVRVPGRVNLRRH